MADKTNFIKNTMLEGNYRRFFLMNKQITSKNAFGIINGSVKKVDAG